MVSSATHRGQNTKRLKIRNAGTSLHDLTFKASQRWVDCARRGSARFIDSGSRLQSATPQNVQDTALPHEVKSPTLVAGALGRKPSKHGAATNRHSLPANRIPHSASLPAKAQRARPSLHRNSLLPIYKGSLSNSASDGLFPWPAAFEADHCAYLMHFFLEKVAPMADIGDPWRNSTLGIPPRSRQCPPLLNAVLTCAAMVLIFSPEYKTQEGGYSYRDIPLSFLTHERVLQHRNACIADLPGHGSGPNSIEDENLFAALVILRFHEEMDRCYTGQDEERLLHALRVFWDAQSNISVRAMRTPTPYNSPNTVLEMGRTPQLHYLKSFKHSIFRNALRQELTAAYLSQRGVHYPLEAWSFVDALEEPDDMDLIWSDRHLLHCARVLNFCYQADEIETGDVAERWRELKDYEALWKAKMPPSFLPLLHEDSGGENSHVLYRVLYVSYLHLTAAQFFELSRILLLVMDPTTPRLGPDAALARQQIAHEVQSIVFFLCSIAASYPDVPPAWMQASMAIFICGDFFTNPQEQEILLAVLNQLEKDHGWPTSQHATRLKEIWGCDG